MKRAIAILLFCAAGMDISATEIIAHRGFSTQAPENTVAALNLAWEHGADACEIDVHLAADGEMVLMHDRDTLKTGGEPNLVVAETDSAELLRLDVGSWKGPEWKAERVPTLAKALATLPEGDERVFIEIKCGPEIVPALKKMLEKMRDREAQLVVISFQRAVVAAVKKAMPWVKVQRLSSAKDREGKPHVLAKILEETEADGADGVALSRDWPWSEAMVAEVREAGMELYVWTVNDPVEVARLAELGVDGIISDDPVMARAAISKL